MAELDELVRRLRELEAKAIAELSKPGPLTQSGYEARKAFTEAYLDNIEPVLKALEEYRKLVGALEFLDRVRWVEVMKPETVIRRAQNLGWKPEASE